MPYPLGPLAAAIELSAELSIRESSLWQIRVEVMKMNGNAELLNHVFQNSQMGVETLRQLRETAKDQDFKEHLNDQLQEYEDFHEEARNLLNAHGFDEKGIKAMDKIRTHLMIDMQTLRDKSASHIAEMLIIGSTMGIIDATKKVRHYQGEAEQEIVDLMERLLGFEEGSIQELKNFL